MNQSKAHLPTYVIVVDEISAQRLGYDDPTGLLDRSDVAIVPVPLPERAPTWQQDLLRRGQLILDHALIRDPLRHGAYVAPGDADWAIASTKATLFSELCQLLGARTISVEMINEKSRRGTLSVSLKAGKPLGPSGEGSVKKETLERLVAGMALGDDFVGSEPDLAQAKALLYETGLDGDATMSRLVRSRANTGNRIARSTFRVNLSTEAIRTLEVAAKVKVPTFISVGANIASVVENASEFTATYVVEF